MRRLASMLNDLMDCGSRTRVVFAEHSRSVSFPGSSTARLLRFFSAVAACSSSFSLCVHPPWILPWPNESSSLQLSATGHGKLLSDPLLPRLVPLVRCSPVGALIPAGQLCRWNWSI